MKTGVVAASPMEVVPPLFDPPTLSCVRKVEGIGKKTEIAPDSSSVLGIQIFKLYALATEEDDCGSHA